MSHSEDYSTPVVVSGGTTTTTTTADDDDADADADADSVVSLFPEEESAAR